MKIISAMDEIDPMPKLGKQLERLEDKIARIAEFERRCDTVCTNSFFEAFDHTPPEMRKPKPKAQMIAPVRLTASYAWNPPT